MSEQVSPGTVATRECEVVDNEACGERDCARCGPVIAAETAGLYWRTCDQCALTAICIVAGEHYICEECQAHHERALDAAHDAIRATGLVGRLRDHDIDRIAWAAVKAYTEFDDEPSSGESGPSDDAAARTKQDIFWNEMDDVGRS